MTGTYGRWIAALLLGVPAITPAQNVAIASYPVTPPNTGGPNAITRGPDGALWLTLGSGSIGRMTAAGAFTAYPITTPNSDPQGIAVGPDGALWFTESAGNQIGRITTAGVVTEFPVLTANSSPWGIAAGPDGALWFTENAGDQIGRITTSGTVTEYRNVYGAEPAGITAGPDGALWFTEYIQVGRITTSGSIGSWEVTSTSSSPQGITAGPDGALWFTEAGANLIGRITTAGATTEYSAFGTDPFSITARGSDGALWFTNSYSNGIGRITTAGAVTEYPAPPSNFENTGSTGIATGPDNALWFTEFGAGMIGEAVFVGANMFVSPPGGHPGLGATGTSISFSGNGFAPNETVRIYTSGIGSTVLATAVADSSGSFSSQERYATLPDSPFGYRLFLGNGVTSGKIAAATFQVTPKLLVSPSFGPPGGTSSAKGYGYAAFDTVDVYWESPYTFLGSAVADSTGTFVGSAALTFTIPSGLGFGDYQLDGVGTNVPQANDTATLQVQ